MRSRAKTSTTSAAQSPTSARIDDTLAGPPIPQRYDSRPSVDGVRLLPVKRFIDDGGALLELARLEMGRLIGIDDTPTFELRQITFSELQPGAVKAWHVHRRQDDLWFVPPGQRLLVGLWDVRADSPTHAEVQRLVLGDGVAQLLFIPRGVAHGAANPYGHVAYMVYLLNQQFQAEGTDELRFPWDAKGDTFWKPTSG